MYRSFPMRNATDRALPPFCARRFGAPHRAATSARCLRFTSSWTIVANALAGAALSRGDRPTVQPWRYKRGALVRYGFAMRAVIHVAMRASTAGAMVSSSCAYSFGRPVAAFWKRWFNPVISSSV